ncbi:MAG: acyl carrier protein [Sphingobacteriales bacterium]|jgi:acyl carrier protein
MQTFILEKIEEIAFSTVQATEELWESRILDSITIVELATELEDEYNIEIPFEEIITDNFGTVEKMELYLNSKINP